MDIQTLSEIVCRAQNGNYQARQELYLDSGKSVYFLALKIVMNPDEAEDITQDVFITVFERIAELEQPTAYYKWVHRIASNKCLDFLRKKKPVSFDEQDMLSLLELEDADESRAPEKLFEDEETRRLILEIIDALPDSQRICVMYRYYSQFSIEETAALTDTNEHTVESRLMLARRKIREAILEKEEKEGIRLHAFIPIMPILMKALDDFQMPEGLIAQMWERIAVGVEFAAASGGAVAQVAQASASAQAQSSAAYANSTLQGAGLGPQPLQHQQLYRHDPQVPFAPAPLADGDTAGRPANVASTGNTKAGIATRTKLTIAAVAVVVVATVAVGGYMMATRTPSGESGAGGVPVSTPSQRSANTASSPDNASLGGDPSNSTVQAADTASSQADPPSPGAADLTEEEEKMIGVWEAEDGSIVAVRARGSRQSDNFPFDAIYLEPVSGEWIKITRETTTFEVRDGVYIMSDIHPCPDPSNPEGGNLLDTEERLEYDPTSGTLLHVMRHPTSQGLMEWTDTLERSDKCPTDPSVEWDWYYKIHPSRK